MGWEDDNYDDVLQKSVIINYSSFLLSVTGKIFESNFLMIATNQKQIVDEFRGIFRMFFVEF